MAHPAHWRAHRVCEDCWRKQSGSLPVRVPFDLAHCCLCGALRNLDIEVVLAPGVSGMCGCASRARAARASPKPTCRDGLAKAMAHGPHREDFTVIMEGTNE